MNKANAGFLRDKCNVMRDAVVTQQSGFASSNNHCGAVTLSSTSFSATQAGGDMKPSNNM